MSTVERKYKVTRTFVAIVRATDECAALDKGMALETKDMLEEDTDVECVGG